MKFGLHSISFYLFTNWELGSFAKTRPQNRKVKSYCILGLWEKNLKNVSLNFFGMTTDTVQSLVPVELETQIREVKHDVLADVCRLPFAVLSSCA